MNAVISVIFVSVLGDQGFQPSASSSNYPQLFHGINGPIFTAWNVENVHL